MVVIAAVLTAASCSKCANDKTVDETTYVTIDQYAGKDGCESAAVSDNELALERLILDIRSRERRLETEIGPTASDRFNQALTDSIRAIDPALAANLKL